MTEEPPRCALRASNGQWVCAEGGGGGIVNANRNWRDAWETFVLRDVSSSQGRYRYNHSYTFQSGGGDFLMAPGGGGGALLANGTVSSYLLGFRMRNPAGLYVQGDLRHESVVGLETQNVHYVCAEGGGGREVVANRDQLGPWELFTIDLFVVGALRTAKGRYLCAEGGGGREINATRTDPSDWEMFEMCCLSGWPLEDGDRVALRADNGRYVYADGGGGGALLARGPAVGGWEPFTVKIHDHSKPWSWSLSLQTVNGKWVCAEGGGGGEVNATRDVPLSWETFEFTRIRRYSVGAAW